MWQVVCADVLEWCENYTGEPFHALLCDPPYALNFMNKAWDNNIAFKPETWAALAEHLLPGGFVMAFASSRGWHRLACAMEDSGLIIQPSIFGWLNSQAFPKATRIDTQIDKAAGKLEEREIVGSNPNARPNSGRTGGIMGDARGRVFNTELTAPATDLARAWEGHRYGGQILKNALEPIIVAQKPWERKRLDCIVETGAGSLNIEQSRIMPSFHNQEHDVPVSSVIFEPLLRDADGIPSHIGEPSHGLSPDIDVSVQQPSSCISLDNGGFSRESCLCFLRRTLFALSSGNIGGRALLHDELYQDDKMPSDAECEIFVARLFPNGKWYGLDLTSSLDFQSDCQFCHHFCDELSHDVQEAVLNGTPSLADVLERIYQTLLEPSHNPCSDNDHRPIQTWISSFAYLLYNSILPYTKPLVKSGRWPSNFCLIHSEGCKRVMVEERCPACDGSGMVEAEPITETWEEWYAKVEDHGGTREEYDRLASPGGSAFCKECAGKGTVKRVGVKRVKGGAGWNKLGQFDAWRKLEGRDDRPAKPEDDADPNGYKHVDAWECVEGCPARKLGEQSGISGSNWRKNKGDGDTAETSMFGVSGGNTQGQNDKGTAARFFYQANWEYECAENCPVARLDEQAGERKSGGSGKRHPSSNSMFVGTGGNAKDISDSGGASRFFLNADWSHEVAERIAGADPVRYCPKAARKERDAGLDDSFPLGEPPGSKRSKPAEGRKRALGEPRRNFHPTVKPISLCKWLATLLLPPKEYAPRRIAVPFCGSGSEMIGAGLAGWEEVIGIDFKQDYCDITEARLGHWLSSPKQLELP